MNKSVPTWAVVPSNGRSYLRGCLDALAPQVDGIVIVANGSDPMPFEEICLPAIVISDLDSDMNISRWWNMGIDVVSGMMAQDGQWNVLVVNDDVVVPHDFVSVLSSAMRSNTAAIAFPNQHDGHRSLWREPGPVNLFWRITGYCFMMRGELGLRLDESMAWWASDDDLDWRARTQGGSYLVPGCPVQHHAPNGTFLDHPELHEQAARDMETFERKWDRRPW